MTNDFMTIADYWVLQGFSREEAEVIEREQIEYAMELAEERELSDAGIWNSY